jgi:hypothetical protein
MKILLPCDQLLAIDCWRSVADDRQAPDNRIDLTRTSRIPGDPAFPAKFRQFRHAGRPALLRFDLEDRNLEQF